MVFMIYWYPELYMDQTVARNPEKCKKRVVRRRPWKKSYVAITLAANEKNLFEIMETRQLFFRRYAMSDIFIVGLAADQESARELLQQMVENMWRDGRICHSNEFFERKKFVRL